jgi:hypothetical protein
MKERPDDVLPLIFLRSLPPFVRAVELEGGWRLERT